MCPCDCKWSLCVFLCVCVLTDLPHSNDSICNKDEEDDEGLDKSGDSFLTFLKPSQYLCETERDRETVNMKFDWKCNLLCVIDNCEFDMSHF